MGAAVARALPPGRRLLLVDRDQAGLDRVAAGIGRDAETIVCDLTDPAAVRDLAGGVAHLGALVVTAGLSPTMGAGEKIFEVNLVGMARLLDAFGPAVGPGSAAVCFASIAGHMATPEPAVAAVLADPLAPDLVGRLRAAGVDPSEPGTAYGLSKHGVIQLARRTAAGWAPRGGRVLSLSPGIIDTPMGRQELAAQPAMEGMIQLVGGMASPEDVAAVAVFLVSPQARFMNGSDVLVDGGFVALVSAAGS